MYTFNQRYFPSFTCHGQKFCTVATKNEESLQFLIQNPKPHIVRTLRGSQLQNYMTEIDQKPFTSLQKSALIGTLLGDATLQYNSIRYPSYKFHQGRVLSGDVNGEYVNLLYSVFQEMVGTPPKMRLKDGKDHSIWFRTYASKKFEFYANQFYKIDALGQRKKVVPKNIHQWLTPEALAFWFQDDGAKSDCGYTFHTEGFHQPDVKILQKALGRVFSLESSIHRDNRSTGTLYKLYIPSSSRDKLTEIVKPFIVGTRKRKLHN